MSTGKKFEDIAMNNNEVSSKLIEIKDDEALNEVYGGGEWSVYITFNYYWS